MNCLRDAGVGASLCGAASSATTVASIDGELLPSRRLLPLRWRRDDVRRPEPEAVPLAVRWERSISLTDDSPPCVLAVMEVPLAVTEPERLLSRSLFASVWLSVRAKRSTWVCKGAMAWLVNIGKRPRQSTQHTYDSLLGIRYSQ